jgi:hypothetical protein
VSTKPRLQTIVEAAQSLSPLEQLDLIGTLAQALHHNYQDAAPPPEDFWTPGTLEQHLQAQPTRPVVDMASLQADFWPEDESADDLIWYVNQQRRQDRQKD